MYIRNTIKKRVHLLVKLLFFALALVLFFVSYQTVIIATAQSNNNAELSAEQKLDQNEELVYTYQLILMDYYKSIIQTCEERGLSTDSIGSYDDFCDGYYAQSDYLISDYVPFLIEKMTLPKEEINNLSTFNVNYTTDASSSRSGGGDWWIGGATGSNPDTIPAKPNYNDFLFDIRPGDLVFEGIGVGEVVSHIVIFEGKFESNYGTFWRVIESVPLSVKYGVYDRDRLVEKRGHILKVPSASDSVRSNVVNFCKNQIGKPYAIHTNKPLQSNTWMCSTLAWAAYANNGIDLCPNDEGPIFPQTIMNSPYVANVSYAGACEFLEISVVKSYYYFPFFWDWDIELTNKNNTSVKVVYNSRLCWEADARDFTGLNDLVTITIPGNQSKTVRITHNGNGDYVAASIDITVNNTFYKLVSYVNELKYENNQGKTANVRNYTKI